MIQKLIQLRIIVGFLGEKNQYNWWDTSFLNATGLKFLEINFPRSAFSAGMHSVTEAAKRLHDSRIGRGRVFHLFRLPIVTEQKIHAELLAASPEAYLGQIESKDAALDTLRILSRSGIQAPEGPVQVGEAKRIMSEYAIEEMAKHYYAAFTSSQQTFPYFRADWHG